MMRLLTYRPEEGLRELSTPAGLDPRQDGQVVWLDIIEPTEQDAQVLLDVFRLHPLAVEDCLHHLQRPKLDEYEDYVFLVTHALRYWDAGAPYSPAELDLVLGDRFLVSVHREELPFLQEVAARVKKSPSLLGQGPDSLLYQIVDAMMDGYFPPLERIGEELLRLEDLLLRRPDRALLNHLFRLRRHLLQTRRLLSPQREVFNLLLRHDQPHITPERRVYLMDVYDHVLRLFETADNYQELAASVLEAYLSLSSNRLNEIMKILTIFTTVLMPLTVITGIYGMNFRYMPELQSRWGYPAVLAVMALITLGMLYYFRRKRWL